MKPPAHQKRPKNTTWCSNLLIFSFIALLESSNTLRQILLQRSTYLLFAPRANQIAKSALIWRI